MNPSLPRGLNVPDHYAPYLDRELIVECRAEYLEAINEVESFYKQMGEEGDYDMQRNSSDALRPGYIERFMDEACGLAPVPLAAAIVVKMRRRRGILPLLDNWHTLTASKMTLREDDWASERGVWLESPDSRAASSPKGGRQTQLTMYKACSRSIPVPHELESDYRQVCKMISDKASFRLERLISAAAINGDGSGKPTGVVRPLANDAKRVVTSSSRSVVSFNDFFELAKKVSNSHWAQQAHFLMHPRTALSMESMLADCPEQRFHSVTIFRQGRLSRILGAKIVTDPIMDEVADGAIAILYGNLKEFAVVRWAKGFWVNSRSGESSREFFVRCWVDVGIKNRSAAAVLCIKASGGK